MKGRSVIGKVHIDRYALDRRVVVLADFVNGLQELFAEHERTSPKLFKNGFGPASVARMLNTDVAFWINGHELKGSVPGHKVSGAYLVIWINNQSIEPIVDLLPEGHTDPEVNIWFVCLRRRDPSKAVIVVAHGAHGFPNDYTLAQWYNNF